VIKQKYTVFATSPGFPRADSKVSCHVHDVVTSLLFIAELKKLSLSMASIERVWKKAENKTKQTDGSAAQRYATLYSDEA
jgi:hypothetical protein